MRKKILIILSIIVITFFTNNSVFAQERKYEAHGKTFIFNVTEEGVTITSGTEDSIGESVYVDTTDFENYVAQIDSDEPFAMYICYYWTVSYPKPNTPEKSITYYFFPSELEKEAYEENYHRQTNLYKKLEGCDYFEEKISGSNEKKCPLFEKLKKGATIILDEYKVCTSDFCKLEKLNEYNNQIKSIKNSCNTIFKYATYDSECVKNCLNLASIDAELKKEYGINSNSDYGQCGFSQRLLVWLSNILRWVKYIVPVIVIIFGILDFIKAVGADKDDEMKKAQGRFIKRLIAAALIFIVPLILEFVLDKMGFGYDTCGLF